MPNLDVKDKLWMISHEVPLLLIYMYMYLLILKANNVPPENSFEFLNHLQTIHVPI